MEVNAQRDIGRMGENSFASLCAEIGLTANKSDVDTTGWDYFIEFPFDDINSVPLDMLKSALECKVQVKSTDNINYRYHLKVSNLRRLATTLSPAFIVVLGFNNKNSIQDAYLIHVGEDLIGKILKKIRFIEQVEKNKSLNKKVMYVCYNSSMKLFEVTGQCLKDKIVSYVGDNIDRYVKNKQNILKTIGFEDGSGIVHFSVLGRENFEKMVDAFLGKAIEVDNISCQIFNTRFGIRSHSPTIDLTSAKMVIDSVKPYAHGEAYFSHKGISFNSKFPCKIYITPFGGILQDIKSNLRIAGEFFEIIGSFSSNSAHISFDFENNNCYGIEELKNISRLYKILCTDGEDVDCSIIFDNKNSLRFCFESNLPRDDANLFLSIVEKASFLAFKFEVFNNVSASINSIRNSRRSIEQLWALVTGYINNLIADFTLVENVEIDNSKIARSLFFSSTTIGKTVLGAIFSSDGALEISDGNLYKFKGNNIRIEKVLSAHLDKFYSYDEMVQEFEKLESIYDDEYQVIRLFAQGDK